MKIRPVEAELFYEDRHEGKVHPITDHEGPEGE